MNTTRTISKKISDLLDKRNERSRELVDRLHKTCSTANIFDRAAGKLPKKFKTLKDIFSRELYPKR